MMMKINWNDSGNLHEKLDDEKLYAISNKTFSTA
jgi:hypothetical protein